MLSLYSKHITMSHLASDFFRFFYPVETRVVCWFLGGRWWWWWWWWCMLWSCLLPCSSSSQVGLAVTTYWACLSNNIIYTATKTTNIQLAFTQSDLFVGKVCGMADCWWVGSIFHVSQSSELLSVDLCWVCTLQSRPGLTIFSPNSDIFSGSGSQGETVSESHRQRFPVPFDICHWILVRSRTEVSQQTGLMMVRRLRPGQAELTWLTPTQPGSRQAADNNKQEYSPVFTWTSFPVSTGKSGPVRAVNNSNNVEIAYKIVQVFEIKKTSQLVRLYNSCVYHTKPRHREQNIKTTKNLNLPSKELTIFYQKLDILWFIVSQLGYVDNP